MKSHDAGSGMQAMLRDIGPIGLIAVAAMIVAIGVALFQLPGIGRAVMVAGTADQAAAASDDARAQQFAQAMERHLDQFDGRSMFFVPGAPPPLPVERVAEGPRTPTRYEGPSIVAMINGRVWFSDGSRLEVSGSAEGETDANERLAVVEIRAPWGALVRWNGVEFDVPLFERTTDRFLAAPSKQPAAAEPAPETQSNNDLTFEGKDPA